MIKKIISTLLLFGTLTVVSAQNNIQSISSSGSETSTRVVNPEHGMGAISIYENLFRTGYNNSLPPELLAKINALRESYTSQLWNLEFEFQEKVIDMQKKFKRGEKIEVVVDPSKKNAKYKGDSLPYQEDLLNKAVREPSKATTIINRSTQTKRSSGSWWDRYKQRQNSQLYR